MIGIGIGIIRRRDGVAPVIVTAASILAQPLVGVAVELDEGEVTGATSTTYQWYRGAPTTTPISGATSASYTAVAADYGLVLYRRRTSTNATGSTIDDTAAPSVTGRQFSETFSGMTNGDVTATVLAYGWTRSGTSFDFSVVTDAEAPSGKALEWWGIANQTRSLYRNDWDTFANANSADDYEELFLYLHQTAVARMHLRPHNGAGLTGTNLGPGFAIRLNNVYAQLPGDDPTNPDGTLLTALTVGTYYWFRKRSSGNTCYYKVWSMTNAEPSAWDVTRTHGSALANRGPTIGYRAGGASDKQRVLYVSSGHRTSAPYPADFELPLPSSADAMTYAAGSSATSFVQNSRITWNFASASQGRYANGDPFIVNSGGVTFTSIAPASANVSGRQTNGAQVDYGKSGGASGPADQGMDGYVPTAGLYLPYDGTDNVDPGKTGSSLVFSTGTEGSILKAVSKTTPDPLQYARDRIDYIGVMTVVGSAPAANSFRPGVSASSKASSWVEADMDTSGLRSLALPGSAPSSTNALLGQRWPLQTWSVNNDQGRTARGNLNHEDYGPNIIRDMATAILLMNCNIDSTVKRNLAVAVTQRGIDVYARALEGGDWSNGGGGTGNGRKLALAFAAHVLDDAGMKAYCDPMVHAIWTEDLQHRYVSASDVATYDYEALDEGMPEWMSSPYIVTPSRAEAASYRAINTNWQPGAALALMLIGAKTTWANDAFFDYCDRIMARTFFDGSGTSQWALSLTGTNSPPQFHRDMWNSFRSTTGMPAVWNW